MRYVMLVMYGKHLKINLSYVNNYLITFGLPQFNGYLWSNSDILLSRMPWIVPFPSSIGGLLCKLLSLSFLVCVSPMNMGVLSFTCLCKNGMIWGSILDIQAFREQNRSLEAPRYFDILIWHRVHSLVYNGSRQVQRFPSIWSEYHLQLTL